MPAPKKEAPPDSMYPAIETFIETASAADVAALLQPVKDALKDVKGPRAESAKKAVLAVDRTHELLGHLLQVREKLTAEAKKQR